MLVAGVGGSGVVGRSVGRVGMLGVGVRVGVAVGVRVGVDVGVRVGVDGSGVGGSGVGGSGVGGSGVGVSGSVTLKGVVASL